MKKIELEIVAIQINSSGVNTYSIVLGEVNGSSRLPIIIGEFEAQSIALAMEGMQANRPLSHDFIVNLSEVFGIAMLEVHIYKAEQGVFSSILICRKQDEEYKLEIRTSDALAIAIRTGAPIYTNDKVLEKSGITNEEIEIANKRNALEQPAVEDKEDADASKYSSMSLEELERLLEEAISEEDYQLAIILRDEIARKNQ